MLLWFLGCCVTVSSAPLSVHSPAAVAPHVQEPSPHKHTASSMAPAAVKAWQECLKDIQGAAACPAGHLSIDVTFITTTTFCATATQLNETALRKLVDLQVIEEEERRTGSGEGCERLVWWETTKRQRACKHCHIGVLRILSHQSLVQAKAASLYINSPTAQSVCPPQSPCACPACDHPDTTRLPAKSVLCVLTQQPATLTVC